VYRGDTNGILHNIFVLLGGITTEDYDFDIDNPNLGIIHFVFGGLVKQLEEEMQELGDDTDVGDKDII
jgi:hypothetical protein